MMRRGFPRRWGYYRRPFRPFFRPFFLPFWGLGCLVPFLFLGVILLGALLRFWR